MIIGTCGFCSTGSSAVSDYLKEFDENQVLDKDEFELVYIPDGLEDLEYHLTKHISRDDSCSLAIPRFRRCMKRYEGNNEQLKKNTEDFLNKIVQMEWVSVRRTDKLLYPSFLYSFFAHRIMFGKVIPFINKRVGHPIKIYPNRKLEVSINPKNFEKASIEFVSNILNILGADFSKNIVLDQPFTGDDPVRSFKYFGDAKAIVVDRDPRDNYLFAKKVLSKKSNIMPMDNVEEFVKYYRLLRDCRPYKEPNQNVLLIHFEDMVYDYDNTTSKIRTFLGLSKNNHPKTIFDPSLSIQNTQLIRRFPEYQKDIEYIEKELPEYLFNFDDYPVPVLDGVMFRGKSPLNKR